MTPADAPVDPGLELDAYLAAFEEAAADGSSPDVARFLPPPGHSLRPIVLRELLRVDLEFAWSRGTRRFVESYRERFPEVFRDPIALRDLAHEEYRLRKAAGESPGHREYRDRLGVDLGMSDGELHDTHWTLAVPVSWPEGRIPTIGDTIPPGYHLVGELGRGAFGRVFLARESGLGGRLVAVKISSKIAGESLTLARLQHTNIVPVYAAHVVGGSSAIVMPYLGRTTLADLIASLRSGVTPHSGRGMVSTLVDRGRTTVGEGPVEPAKPEPVPSPGVSRATLDALERMTFVEAALWMGAELADGLAHAHDRGILHRDIKPANVLLTDDGRPMLLDFNLAVAEPGQVCGTPAYMAPEQLEAARNDRGVGTVQSDIYSLGLVLVELLAGRTPFSDPSGQWKDVLSRMVAERSCPPLEVVAFPPDVTPGVRAILAKCLEPDPRARYESASQLREDLERQRTDQPLRFALEGSTRERVRKWSRRHPRLSSAGMVTTLAVVVILGIASVLAANQRRLDLLRAESARAGLRDAREYTQAGVTFGPSDPESQWREVARTATSALAPYRVEGDYWVHDILVARLPPSEQAEVRRDAAEVMFRAAEATQALATRHPADQVKLLGEALEWNRRACVAYPDRPPAAFLMQQSRLLRSLGREAGASRAADAAREREAESLDDPAARGRAALDASKYREASSLFREAAHTGPPRYSVWMGLAAAEMKLRHYGPAIDALTAASALRPTAAQPHYHRGVARLEVNAPAAALADFDRYLELTPDDPDGLLNRAAARFLTGDDRGAVADLDTAARNQSTRTRLFALRAEAKRRLGDATGADQDRATFLAAVPTDASSANVRGELKRDSRPRDATGALADFDTALSIDPDFLPALRNKANLLSEDPVTYAAAIEVLDRVVALATDSVGDRAGRAVLLARVGRTAEALREVADCRPLARDGITLYQLASAALVAGDKSKGLALLRGALREDPALGSLMPDDPDLKLIRKDAEFLNLIAAASTLNR